MKPPPARADELRGAARLATDATRGLTDLVEAMHERIARLPGRPAPANGRTQGITGLVYKTVRGVTRLAGGGVDALLALVGPALGGSAPTPGREAFVAALNGVVGDHLQASGNPLAIAPGLRRDAAAPPSSRLLVLAHGLCMGPGQWMRDGHDHGQALARELGFTPIYLDCNSGLPIAVNGAEFARQLQRLVDEWPVKAQRLVLLGHSMGGLLARSAVQHAQSAGMGWPGLLTDLICLGTPHHGAPLERAGHGLDLLLERVPYAAPLARLGKLRSAGITDLRHGSVPGPLPAGVRCFALAGTTGKAAGDLKDKLLGDGLVPLASALGRHKKAALTLDFPPERQWVGAGLNHMQLLSSPAVYAQLRRWLAPP